MPLAIEFARDEESSRLLRLVDAPGAMAKPFTLPPGVDPPRASKSCAPPWLATYHDQALLDEARADETRIPAEDRRAISTKIPDDVLAMPPAVAAKYREIIQP